MRLCVENSPNAAISLEVRSADGLPGPRQLEDLMRLDIFV
jgi:hypothetical protein